MSGKAKSLIFWLIWLATVIGILWWFAYQAAGATPPLPLKKIKQAHKSAAVQQGDGASALIAKAGSLVPAAPPGPTPKPIFPPFYFVVTATATNGLESNYSNEAIFTNTIPGLKTNVTLGWDASVSDLPISNYTIFMGRVSGVYTNRFNAGTNLALSVSLYGPRLTNWILFVTTTNATNLAMSDSLSGPWTLLNTNNWTATNPPAPRFFLGVGESENRVMISHQQF